ncbi:MAG TPA: diacylglycerol kinase family protein [Hyphomicrobium sp.]|nr:diacylglycerol kinase family protein [Hyphomicrobium sp.]
MRRRLLIIHNAYAGTRGRSRLRAVVRHLEDAGTDVRTEHAAHIDDDAAVARQAVVSGTYDAVVAAGGDSTVRGVACGLIGSAIPLGLIPVGTGNVLAREIGIRWSAKALADTLLNGPSVAIKYGLADGTPFLSMAGLGYDADVLVRLNTPLKRSVGRLAYAWPVLCELARKPKPFELTVDGRVLPATWAVVTRTAHYGGSFVIAMERTLTADGFHAVIANVASRRALLSVLLSLARGSHANHPDVTVLPCAHVGLGQNSAVSAQIDGERLASAPREITLGQESLHLIVPPRSPLAAEGTPASEHMPSA